MSGPSAEAAETSDWFTCESDSAVEAPVGASCATAFLQDPTRDGCARAVDENGNACEFCTFLNGLSAVCLTAQQVDQAPPLFGLSCDSLVNDPYDPSCVIAFMQDSSEDACVSTADMDGNACEFCSFQGALDVCLTQEQAEMGEQFGITCGQKTLESNLDDPYDPTCVMAYLQDPTKEGCINTNDMDGNPCEFCTLQGALDVCLTEEQAEMGEQFGISCEDSGVKDPYDPSCAFAYLQDNSPEACKAAVDADGKPCEYRTLQGALNLCLTEEQAEMGEQFGIECDEMHKHDEKVDLPDDFFECLQEFQEGDCRASSCTWCNTQVGIGFCLSTPAAEATKECTFFDCEYGTEKDVAIGEEQTTDILDPVCLAAGMNSDNAENDCENTNDTDGNACVWCDAAGVFGLCLSSDQAEAAGQYLMCNQEAKVATA